MYTFNPTHNPARFLFHTGSITTVRPSMGAWISYGLGTENANLPVLSCSVRTPAIPICGGRVSFQGSIRALISMTPSWSRRKMIRYLRNTQMDAPAQRRQLDLIQALNRRHEDSSGKTRSSIRAFAPWKWLYRMQLEAWMWFDLRQGARVHSRGIRNHLVRQRLPVARRLVERGVRCVSVYYGQGQPWDDHKDIHQKLTERCPDMDQAAAALIGDLKRRGLLDETLVVWGGEFGRTPVSENGDGRDHNPYGYTMWLPRRDKTRFLVWRHRRVRLPGCGESRIDP